MKKYNSAQNIYRSSDSFNFFMSFPKIGLLEPIRQFRLSYYAISLIFFLLWANID